MEFEEMKKIWMAESQETVYVINETALHNRIISKRKAVLHISNISELLLIIINFSAGCAMIGITYWNGGDNIFMYAMAIWMLLTAVYVLVSRVRRLRAQLKFDRSMLEDLRHAIATATYQVRLSWLMRLNVLPIGILSILSVWQGSKSIWLIVAILGFFILSYYLSGWELNIYKNKKRELELLQEKFEKE
jgi:hypothetical protein